MASGTFAVRQSLVSSPCTHTHVASRSSVEGARHACAAVLPGRSSAALLHFRPISRAGTPSGVCQRSSFSAGTPLRWTDKVQLRSYGERSCASLPICAGGVADVGDSDFEKEVESSSIPVLVDFHASWCGPCKLVAPLMNWAAETYDGKLKVVKVDVQANPETTKKYRVYGLPTVLIFESGKVLTHYEGAINKEKLDKLLKEKLPVLV